MIRSRLRRVSKKRRDERALRLDVCERVTARDVTCRARWLVDAVDCRGPLDHHEVIPRSLWRAGYLDVRNVILICRAHHDWVGANPALAESVGLHGQSWQRPRDAGGSIL